ncbi:hypothetical protein NMY22_g5719 [Coprinellus aureogranulatus]|nr:hypothetical protein NMY22_g5719 [Coprinellus aureogranulatus]
MRPHPSAFPLPSGSNNDLNRPPRYSDITPFPHRLSPPRSSQSIAAEFVSSESATHRSSSTVPSRVSQFPPPMYAMDGVDLDVSASTLTLANPPRYSGLSDMGIVSAGDSTAATRQEYAYPIRSAFRSEPWAILRLYDAGPPASQRARKRKHPRFFAGDEIVGSVDLSLSSSQIIRNMKLSLKGTMITGVGEGGSITFLEHECTLWDSKFGDPWLLHQAYLPSPGKKYDGKLSGNWKFPFTIPFPTHLDLSTLRGLDNHGSAVPMHFLPQPLLPSRPDSPSSGRQDSSLGASGRITPFDALSSYDDSQPSSPMAEPSSPSLEPYRLHPSSSGSSSYVQEPSAKPGVSPLRQIPSSFNHNNRRWGTGMQATEPSTAVTRHALPQSFLERDVMANIQYELVLTISHGRFSTKSRVSAPLMYAPISTPPPMSFGRQVAYGAREIPPSPAIDPDAWRKLTPVSIKGTYLDQREVTVHYDLFLAMPLSYAQGTTLPCYLTISCDDITALNVLANPQTPRIRLRRLTRFLQNQSLSQRQKLLTLVPPICAQASIVSNHYPDQLRLSDTPLQLAELKTLRRVRTGQTSGENRGTGIIEPFVTTSGMDKADATLGSSDEEDSEEVADRAVWCAPLNLTQEPQVRTLYGEIHLPKGLQPTCKFPLFNILYRIELLAPATNAFFPIHISTHPLAKAKSAPINPSRPEITTKKASVYTLQNSSRLPHAHGRMNLFR